MSKRSDLRAQYIEVWETMDSLKLVSSVTDDFVFDDPAEPRPITKAELADYMPIWPAKAKALGTAFEFDIVDKVVQDRQVALLEWYWWRLMGTDVEGAAGPSGPRISATPVRRGGDASQARRRILLNICRKSSKMVRLFDASLKRVDEIGQ